MKTAFCIIRKHGDPLDDHLYWGTVRQIINESDTFCYDTKFFFTIEEVKKECRAFCKWKGLRITKYKMEI